MTIFHKINRWISDHKILSGFAGVLVIALVTLYASKGEKKDQSGNINFGNDTEINNSNVYGRDININEVKNKPSKIDSVYQKEDSDSIIPNKKEKTERKKEDVISSQKAPNKEISHSYIAGRDININNKNQEELIETLKYRAENINKNLQKYYYYTEVAEFLDEFNALHKKHIQALENNNFLLAHEILSRIHYLSFDIDSKEEAQQIKLYGDIRNQYLTSLDREDLLGGLISLYFEKKITPYDSTTYAGNVVYYNQIKNIWPGYPIEQDSIKMFYYKNFLLDSNAASR